MPPPAGHGALRRLACRHRQAGAALPACAARPLTASSSPPPSLLPHLRPAGSRPWPRDGSRSFSTHRPDRSAPASSEADADADADADDTRLRPIRERLRDWVAAEAPVDARLIPRDFGRWGATQNSLTRVESHTLVEIDGGTGADTGDGAGSGGDGLLATDADADADNVPSALARPYGAVAPRAGDLIEVSTDSWRVQLLAVCLGNFRGVDHFYTNTGKWFVSAGVRSLFGVTGFARPEALAPVIAALPSFSTAADGADGLGVSDDDLEAKLNTLQDLKMGPTREAGAGLLKMMQGFLEQSAAIHMTHAAVLDKAFAVLQADQEPAGAPGEATQSKPPRPYMSLDEIAAVLLRHDRPKHKQTHWHGRSPAVRNVRTGGGAHDAVDEFTPPAMYAVYRALMADDLAFRPLTTTVGNASGAAADEAGEADEADEGAAAAAPAMRRTHSRSCLFAIAPPADIAIVREVEELMRDFSDPAPRLKQFSVFAGKARWAIDQSRRTRPWSPYGMLGPAVGGKPAPPAPPPHAVHWSDWDVRILQFMHLWASAQRFSPASRLHWVGSYILRALDRYADAEYLTMATGWTFLQEVGWVTPWDLPARYSMALPDVPPLRTGGVSRSYAPADAPALSSSSRPALPQSDDLLQPDLFAGRRRDWGHLTAFCIDAPGAEDIDDAVALERIPGAPDEFWIHVHVADPGSCIRPGSPLAELAARLPQTAYLPGHHERMFPDDAVRTRFSLAPGRPCLTFSARVNRAGAVLATAIAPGRLGSASQRAVVFITPAEVAAVVAGAEAEALRACSLPAPAEPTAAAALDRPAITLFAVGRPPAAAAAAAASAAAAARHMTTAAELTPPQRADLETLAALATALRAVRLANGAMPLYWPRPSVQVALDDVDVRVPAAGSGSGDAAAGAFLQCSGDPYIRIGYEELAGGGGGAGSRLVESTMRLAGEVAADWCHARGIAVPFRGQPDAVRHLPRLRALTRDVVYPALVRGQRPPEAALRTLRRLLGADDVTATAAPHVTMGVARYTKATSPLRRYADLVVHWQIEGALLAEAEAEAAAGARTAAGPPFTRAQMERDVLPLLRVRERALRALDNRAGRDQWMLQALVRAWLGEAATATTADGRDVGRDALANLHLTVTGVDPRRGVVRGRLDWFDRAALMEVAGLNPDAASDGAAGPAARLALEDVKPGQVYPVALEHVDVHGNRVLVRRR